MSAARRLVAATGAGMLALLTVAPPARAADPKATLTSPVTLVEQRPITGTITTVPADDQTLSEASYNLVPESGPYAPGDPCLTELSEDQKGQTFPEETAEAAFTLDVDFPCNGAFVLSVLVDYERPVVGGIGLTRTPEEATAMLEFSVAIPPAQVQALNATYDAATREVRLEWKRNPEPDVVSYSIERDPPGRDPVSRIGEVSANETTFIDRDIGEEHRYRVIALRAGPDQPIPGKPSLYRSAGPEAPEPTVPEAPPPNPSNSGGSGGAANQPGKSSGASRPPSRTRPTTDTGFEQALPFDPSQTTTIPPDDSATGPPGDAAVLAEFDDAVSDEEQQRATLVPVAGGLALIVGALHLFLLSKRAGESDIPIVPR